MTADQIIDALLKSHAAALGSRTIVGERPMEVRMSKLAAARLGLDQKRKPKFMNLPVVIDADLAGENCTLVYSKRESA